MPSQVNRQPEESFLSFPTAVTVSGTAIIPRPIPRLFKYPFLSHAPANNPTLLELFDVPQSVLAGWRPISLVIRYMSEACLLYINPEAN